MIPLRQYCQYFGKSETLDLSHRITGTYTFVCHNFNHLLIFSYCVTQNGPCNVAFQKCDDKRVINY